MILTTALIAGCQTIAGDFCDVSSAYPAREGVFYSTAEKRWIVSHNEYGETKCGWEP